ncbi:MAG TPA: DUF2726 domain-containing protein [Polaromonas sp.]|uniref:DUF2726 domain-containing protein n=1 Tax=Polaromonas sp. TaxID=1869339 RepID=UPI002D253921|nr:DUF2726 domain-containing protein [Polaromonas sp.]HYW57794.1 DUF2726 domain-containing protein [Polaromonas sp.]
MSSFSWLMAVIFVVAGFIAGLLIYDTWLKWKERERRRLPNRWPLGSRALLTPDEREVWRWLIGAFYDHHVIIKTPVARFTRPRNKEQGKSCAELLAGVYCSFTVCTSDGTVIGCVDVPGQAGLLRSHRDMKESILTDCGIAYSVVRANNLPGLETMRAAFLGEINLEFMEPEKEVVAHDEFTQELVTFSRANSRPAPLDDARTSFHSKLEFARKVRVSGFNPLITQTGIVEDGPKAGFKSKLSWEDSFLSPLRTNIAPLN